MHTVSRPQGSKVFSLPACPVKGEAFLRESAEKMVCVNLRVSAVSYILNIKL